MGTSEEKRNVMIRLEHVSKRFEAGGQTVEAVKDVSLHIEKGSIAGIIGFSGAGKSTIARMVAGRLGYLYVDTGALYRTIALFFLRQFVYYGSIRKLSGYFQCCMRYV